MNDQIQVTFIGGSADLTRRVMPRHLCRYVEVPVIQPAYFNDPRLCISPAQKLSFQTERYEIVQVGRTTAVAVLESMTR